MLLRKVAPALLPQLGGARRAGARAASGALLKHFELADFDRDEKFLKNYASASRRRADDGAAALRQAAIDVPPLSAGEMHICTPPAQIGEEGGGARDSGDASAWEAADARNVASTRACVD